MLALWRIAGANSLKPPVAVGQQLFQTVAGAHPCRPAWEAQRMAVNPALITCMVNLARKCKRALFPGKVSEAERLFLARSWSLPQVIWLLIVGAHVGKYTEMLAVSGADVIAFEPDPKVFGLLNARVSRFENVQTIPAAVGAKDGTVLWG
jgi:hypothetical protein